MVAAAMVVIFAGASLPSCHGVLVNFEFFPGPDNSLGTPDDIPITATVTHFTTEFAFLDGGVGFVVDSLSGTPDAIGVGGIEDYGNDGDNRVGAARPEIGPTAFSFGPHRYRFVSSLDGLTPALVSDVSLFVGLDANNTATDTIQFFDGLGGLLHTITLPNTPGQTVAYSNPVGIGSILITTTFSVASDDLEYTPLLEPSSSAAPEPSTVALLGLGGLLVLGRRSRQA